jgi:hypothetical protein
MLQFIKTIGGAGRQKLTVLLVGGGYIKDIKTKTKDTIYCIKEVKT